MPHCQPFNSARHRKREPVSKHFYDKASYNASGTPPDALDHYAMMYVSPWARRAAFLLYEAFKLGADENVKYVTERGKCKVAALGLDGEFGPPHRIWKACCRRCMNITPRVWYWILDTGSRKKIQENVK